MLVNIYSDGTTYTITGVNNIRYRGLASVVSQQYDGFDTYPPDNNVCKVHLPYQI